MGGGGLPRSRRSATAADQKFDLVFLLLFQPRKPESPPPGSAAPEAPALGQLGDVVDSAAGKRPRQSRCCAGRKQIADRRIGQAGAGRRVMHGHPAETDVYQASRRIAAPDHNLQAERLNLMASVRPAVGGMRGSFFLRATASGVVMHAMVCSRYPEIFVFSLPGHPDCARAVPEVDAGRSVLME